MAKSAKTSPHIREQLVRRYLNGEQVAVLAEQFGLSKSWLYRLIRTYKSNGDAAFQIGNCRPRNSPNSLALGTCFSIQALAAGGWPQWRIAKVLKVSESTVSRVLVRMLGKRWKSRREPVLRYEHDAPGSLVHLDIKRVSQFDEPGWRVTGDRSRKTKGVGHQYVHVCVDDHSRIAHAEQLEDQKGLTAVAFMRRMIKAYKAMGHPIQRVMTDNGPCYQSGVFRALLKHHGIRHIFTRPFTPQTNGKAERFIKTLMAEWGYGKSYPNSQVRKTKLPCYLSWYNHIRPHGSLNRNPPVSRLTVNNVLEVYN